MFILQGVPEAIANTDGSTSSRSSGKYTPLGALADLQPGNHGKSSRKTQHDPPVTGLVQPQVHSDESSVESRQPNHEPLPAHSSNTSQSRFSSTIQHQGNYVRSDQIVLNIYIYNSNGLNMDIITT